MNNAPGFSWGISFKFKYQISSETYGKCSQNFLGQFALKEMEMLQMFLGPIPSGSIMKAPLEMNEQCSCNYLGRLLHILHQILVKHQCKILLEFPEKIPSSSIIESLLKFMENAPGAFGANSCTSLLKNLIETNGKWFGGPWNSLGQVLSIHT